MPLSDGQIIAKELKEIYRVLVSINNNLVQIGRNMKETPEDATDQE